MNTWIIAIVISCNLNVCEYHTNIAYEFKSEQQCNYVGAMLARNRDGDWTCRPKEIHIAKTQRDVIIGQE